VPLYTLQAALQAAMVQDDAIKMAEFSLAHAWRLITIIDGVEDVLRAGNGMWGMRGLALLRLFAANMSVSSGRPIRRPSELGRVNSLASIALVQAQSGEEGAARATFAAALRAARAIQEEMWQAEALQVIADAQEQAGEDEEARATFAAAVQTARKIKEAWSRDKALAFIALAQAQAGDLVAARATAPPSFKEESLLVAVREKLLGKLAKMQVQMGEFDAALGTVRRIEDEWEQAEALREIAVAQAQAGEREAAQATFTAALKATEGIEEEEVAAEVRGKIAISQACAGLTEAARAMFSEVLKAIEDIEVGQEINDQLTVEVLAEVLAQVGNKEHLKLLLIPCAYSLDATYMMCGLLARWISFKLRAS